MNLRFAIWSACVWALGCGAESVQADTNRQASGGRESATPSGSGGDSGGTAAAPRSSGSGSGGANAPSGGSGTSGAAASGGTTQTPGAAGTGSSATGEQAQPLIDDFESCDGLISSVAGRDGYWYLFADEDMSLAPDFPNGEPATSTPPSQFDPQPCAAWIVAECQGEACSYAGLGFTLKQDEGPFDLGGFDGITFSFAGSDLRVYLHTASGSFSADVEGAVTRAERTVRFSDLVPALETPQGTAFDPSTVSKVELTLRSESANAFAAAVYDVRLSSDTVPPTCPATDETCGTNAGEACGVLTCAASSTCCAAANPRGADLDPWMIQDELITGFDVVDGDVVLQAEFTGANQAAAVTFDLDQGYAFDTVTLDYATSGSVARVEVNLEAPATGAGCVYGLAAGETTASPATCWGEMTPWTPATQIVVNVISNGAGPAELTLRGVDARARQDACSDECTPGQATCLDSTTLVQCIADHDDDPCFELGPGQACTGECSADACQGVAQGCGTHDDCDDPIADHCDRQTGTCTSPSRWSETHLTFDDAGQVTTDELYNCLDCRADFYPAQDLVRVAFQQGDGLTVYHVLLEGTMLAPGTYAVTAPPQSEVGLVTSSYSAALNGSYSPDVDLLGSSRITVTSIDARHGGHVAGSVDVHLAGGNAATPVRLRLQADFYGRFPE